MSDGPTAPHGVAPIWTLQRALSRTSKQDKETRVYSLYDKVWRAAILWEAWRQVKAHKGAPGLDGRTIDASVATGREQAMIEPLQVALRAQDYRFAPLRVVEMPKLNGGTRPLGIATGAARLVQTAMQLVLEPILAADFHACSDGYRPQRDAQQASRAMREDLYNRAWGVVEIDCKAYCTSLPHGKLMALITKRVADGRRLKRSKQPRKVGGKAQGQGVPTTGGGPQGSPIAPLYSNIYGRLFGRKGTVASMLPWMDGNPRPHSGMRSSQAHCEWSASRRQRDLCAGRRPARGRRVGKDQKGKPVIGEDET